MCWFKPSSTLIISLISAVGLWCDWSLEKFFFRCQRNCGKRYHNTLGSRTGLAAQRASLSGKRGLYPLGPVLLAALVWDPAARFRHLPQGGAVQPACDGESGDPLEVAAEGSSVKHQPSRSDELVRKTVLRGSPQPERGQLDFLLGDLSPHQFCYSSHSFSALTENWDALTGTRRWATASHHRRHSFWSHDEASSSI